MGRIVWDEAHFIASLALAFFIIRWIEGKLDKEGTSYKATKYLFH